MSKHDEPRGFLNRWSARKQAAEQESPVVSTAASAPEAETTLDPVVLDTPDDAVLTSDIQAGDLPAVVAPASDAGADSQQAEASPTITVDDAAPAEYLLSDADMPPIETLTASSDMSAFFNKGVSVALRKAALRHVFRQPSYNVRDGLNDYDGDFTVFEPLGDTITSDMKFHAARKEKARLEAERIDEEARLEAERLAAQESEAQESEVQESEDSEQMDNELAAHDEGQTPSEDQEPQVSSEQVEDTDTDAIPGQSPEQIAAAGQDRHIRNSAQQPANRQSREAEE